MREMATNASASSPPPRRRFAGLVAILGLCVILAGAMAAAVPWLFSTSVLRDEIIAQIRQMTGLSALSQGRAVFVVLPRPHISIEAIRLADPSGALRIDAAYLKGYLRVSALLSGRLEIDSATLGEPRMAIDLDGAPMPPDSAIGRAANAKPSTPQASFADEGRLAAVSLIDGAARLTAKRGQTDILIDAINVTLDWRKLGFAANLAGTARCRGQSADIAAFIERPAELLRGAQSALTLKVSGPALSLSAEGTLAAAPAPQFIGRIAATAPSLRKLIEAGGYFVELPAPFEDFALNADASLDAANASFSNLRLELDGNQYEGALAVIGGDTKPTLSGTLAAEAVSLRPFIAQLPAALGREGQWSHDLFDLEMGNFANVDLRLSASRLTLPGIDLEEAAFSVLKQNGRLDVALIQARAYQGNVKGRASFTRSEAGIEMRASAAIAGADVAAAWPASIESWRIAGAMTASAAVESAGASMSELMRNLEGHATVMLQRGAIGGVNLDSAVRLIDRRPLGIADDIRYGDTPFDSAGFALRIANGVGEIDDGVLHSQALDVGFSGAVDFGERALNLNATAANAGGEGKGEGKPDRARPKFQFDIAGPWDDLALIPDARSLIRQSGAAAPLFSPNPAAIKPTPAAEDH